MFGSVGWGEIVILLAAGLIILGPERLPDAVSWSMKALRQVRDYATGATDQLKNELGPEFDELRKPLSQLNELRGMSPGALVTKHLLDGDDSLFTGGLGATTVDRNVADTPAIKPVSAPMPGVPNPVDGPVPDAVTPDTPGPRRHDITDWDAT